MPPPPPKLKFFASWVQGAQHRKMSLAYDTATKECEVRLDGQAAAFVVSLKDGKGTPLEAIDLRIGRAVDVLGRRRRCSRRRDDGGLAGERGVGAR